MHAEIRHFRPLSSFSGTGRARPGEPLKDGRAQAQTSFDRKTGWCESYRNTNDPMSVPGGGLAKLKDIEQLTPLVSRILGQNPSQYTLQGTNTYLIGYPNSPAVLLDAGQDIPSYIPLLKSQLQRYSHVSDIILSHHHHDHTLGLKSVLPLLRETYQTEIPPRVWKFPYPVRKEGGGGVGQDNPDDSVEDILREMKEYYRAPAEGIRLFDRLEDGQEFRLPCSPTGPEESNSIASATFKVLHTPGHTDDSLAFLLTPPSLPSPSPSSSSSSTTTPNDTLDPSGKTPILFTADTVLGQGTAVFTDLKALLESLQRCIEVGKQALLPCQSASNDADAGPAGTIPLFCGHGPVVEDGIAKMEEYIKHRLQRERQVLEALKTTDKAMTAEELVKLIYGPTLDPRLVQAAEHGLVLHLEKVEREGRVNRTEQQNGGRTLWQLVRSDAKV